MTTTQVEVYNLVTKLLLCLTQLIYVVFCLLFITIFPSGRIFIVVYSLLFIVFVQVPVFIRIGKLSFLLFSRSILKHLFVVISGDTPFYADSLVGTYGECMHCYLFRTFMFVLNSYGLGSF